MTSYPSTINSDATGIEEEIQEDNNQPSEGYNTSAQGDAINGYQGNTANNTTYEVKVTERDCMVCGGTGKIKKRIHVASYGLDTSDKYCDVCHEWMRAGSRHTHVTCKNCGGIGKVKSTTTVKHSSEDYSSDDESVLTNLTPMEQQQLKDLDRELIRGKYTYQKCDYCGGSGLCKNCGGYVGNTDCMLCFGLGTCHWCNGVGGENMYVPYTDSEKAEIQARRDKLLRKAFEPSNNR